MLGSVKKVSRAGRNDDGPNGSSSSLLDAGKQEVTDQLLLAAAQIDYQEDIVRQRGEGINGIQKDLTKINGLFQDMALNVSSQGEMLDHIEANVTSARDRTAQASTELASANRRSPSTRRNLLCLILILLLFVVLIGLLKASAFGSERFEVVEGIPGFEERYIQI